MKNISCIVCRTDANIVLRQQTFDDHYLDLINPSYQDEYRSLVACVNCGFVYHNPTLDETDIEILYSRFRDASFRNESPDEYFDRIVSLPPGESENLAKVSWIKQQLKVDSTEPRLLDIGCGGGVFMYTFAQHMSEWSTFGVEPTISFAELAKRRTGRPVLADSYRPGVFQRERFDLITINQVLEHVPDPVKFMIGVKSDLAQGGHVYLEVPDIEDFVHLAFNHDRFLMQHLWIFSKNSLKNICDQSGYEIVVSDQVTTVRNKRNLVCLLRPMPVTVTPEFVRHKDDPFQIQLLAAKETG